MLSKEKQFEILEKYSYKDLTKESFVNHAIRTNKVKIILNIFLLPLVVVGIILIIIGTVKDSQVYLMATGASLFIFSSAFLFILISGPTINRKLNVSFINLLATKQIDFQESDEELFFWVVKIQNSTFFNRIARLKSVFENENDSKFIREKAWSKFNRALYWHPFGAFPFLKNLIQFNKKFKNYKVK